MTAPIIVESEDAVRTWALAREYAPDHGRPDQVIAPITDATLVLAGIFEPLTLVAELAYVDLEHGYHDGSPDRDLWCLEVDSSPAAERDWGRPDTHVSAATIDRAALEAFVRTAANQPAPAGVSICPVVLRVVAGRALLPEPWATPEDRIRVRFQGGSIELPVEHDARGAWVAGPGETLLRPAIQTRGRVEGDHAELWISAHWSPWYEAGAAGTAAIERAVADLEAQGWRRD